MISHTKGSWKATLSRNNRRQISGPCGRQIAIVWRSSESHANELLICAAPELLSMAIEAADLLSAVDSCSRNNFSNLASEVEEQLRAVIAKATGQTKTAAQAVRSEGDIDGR